MKAERIWESSIQSISKLTKAAFKDFCFMFPIHSRWWVSSREACRNLWPYSKEISSLEVPTMRNKQGENHHSSHYTTLKPKPNANVPMYQTDLNRSKRWKQLKTSLVLVLHGYSATSGHQGLDLPPQGEWCEAQHRGGGEKGGEAGGYLMIASRFLDGFGFTDLQIFTVKLI